MTDAKTTRANPLGDVPDALRRLLRAEMELGKTLLESMIGTAAPTFESLTSSSCCGNSGFGNAKRSRSSCDIPPPCWEPRPLGERTSHVSPCSEVCLEILLDNCGIEAHPVKVGVRGYDDVTITPNTVTLPPLERKRIRVCANIPKGVATGTTYDLTVVIAGCRVHYLRWTLSVGTFGLHTNQKITEHDCADQLHHWYDHFYCRRPCRPRDADGKPSTEVPGVPQHPTAAAQKTEASRE